MPQPARQAGDPILAIGYVRVSMWFEDKISPELQRESISAWAQRRGRRIIDWVEDLDMTGRNFDRKIINVIERIEAGEARECIVWKFNRFGRDRYGQQVNLERIHKAGGELLSSSEDVDVRTAAGKLHRGIHMEFAASQSDDIGEGWKAALAHRRAAGLMPTGRRRFGYVRRGRIPDPERKQRTRRDMADPAGERYEQDLKTGPVLRGMYLAYIGGDLGDPIAQRLNGDGICNALGHRWSAQTVRDYLDSGFGAGYLRVHDPECWCTDPSHCSRRIMIRGTQKPVITEEEWEAYLARRVSVAALPPRSRVPVYDLTGLLACGWCGARAVIGSYKGRWPKIRCPRWNRFRDCPGEGRSVSYRVALDAVKAWVAAEDVRLTERLGARAFSDATAAARAGIGALEAEAARHERALARLVAREALEEEVPAEVWAEAKAALVGQLRAVRSSLAREEHRGNTKIEDIRPVVRGLLDEWDTLPPNRVRDVLASLVSVVVVWRADADGQRLDQARVFPAWEPPWEGPGTAGIPG